MNPAEAYLLSLDSDSSRTTMRSNLNTIAKLLDGSEDLESCDWSLLDYTSALQVRNELNDGRAPSTVNTYLAAIKGVARECWRLKIMEVEAYQQIKELRRLRGSRSSRGRSLNLTELNTILDSCLMGEGPKAIRDAAVIGLCYGAGLRRQEAASLHLSSYDSGNGTVTVIGKGNKERTNTLPQRAIEILECWLDERGREPGPIFVRIYKGGRITKDGITSQTIYDIVVSRYQEAGLKRLTPHDLRRSYATHLFENNEDLLTVMKLMGHTDPSTTRVYDIRGEKHEIAAAKRLRMS